MKNNLLVVLLLVVLGLGGFAWLQNIRIQELETARAAAEKDARQAQADLTTSKQALAAAEKARAALAAQASVRRESPAPDTASTNPVPPRRDPGAVLDNPAVQRMMSASLKNSLDQRYAALFRQLRLSPADLEKFKDLLVEKQMSGIDAMRVAQSRGMTSNPAEMAGLMSKVQGEMDESIHGLLGDQGFQTFQDYNQNIASYTLLDQIERRLSYTNAPLQPAQSDALLQIFKSTTQASALERTPAAGAMAGFVQSLGGTNPAVAALTQRPITNATIEGAQSVLSAPQLEALRQLQAEQQSQVNTLQSMRGALGPGGMGEARTVPAPVNGTPPPTPKN